MVSYVGPVPTRRVLVVQVIDYPSIKVSVGLQEDIRAIVDNDIALSGEAVRLATYNVKLRLDKIHSFRENHSWGYNQNI